MNDHTSRTRLPPHEPNRPDLGHFPPGFQKIVYLLTPRRHRRDMLQEAWLAFLEGRNPSTAARSYLAREVRHERREAAFSQVRPNGAAHCLSLLAVQRYRQRRRR